MPRRVGTGVDPKRLAMIVAVLARHAGLPLGGADVFVNVAGGVRIDEPGADLGIALAIASAARGLPVHEGLAAFGEIGLTGRLRAGDPGRRAGSRNAASSACRSSRASWHDGAALEGGHAPARLARRCAREARSEQGFFA